MGGMSLPRENQGFKGRLSGNVWSAAKKDRDVDDLIFGTGPDSRWEPDVSDR